MLPSAPTIYFLQNKINISLRTVLRYTDQKKLQIISLLSLELPGKGGGEERKICVKRSDAIRKKEGRYREGMIHTVRMSMVCVCVSGYVPSYTECVDEV